MSKHVIIDWQPDGILMATCSGRAAAVHIDRVSLQHVDSSDAASQTLAAALKAAADELKVSPKSSVTIVTSRENAEVRTISVPRMEADELPDIIRFQAQRQLANMSDSWTLDYMMLPDNPSQEMQTALVAAIPPERLSALESACEQANLTIDHLALRPVEIARHADRLHGLAKQGPSLIVSLSQQHVYSMLANNGQIVQIRNTRLPTEASELSKALVGDIRRSMLAAASLINNQAIDQAILIADESLSSQARAAIEEATSASVHWIDSGKFVESSDAFDATLYTNRLAAILGVTHLSSSDKSTTLDFMNPKRRPDKKSRLGQYILGAVALFALVGLGLTWYFQQESSLTQRLADLEEQIESKKPLVKSSSGKLQDLAEIQRFLDASPNFLEELHYVADKMPPSDQILLSGMQFSILNDGSGHIQTTVRADKGSSLSDFEKSLQDEQHIVQRSSSRLTDAQDEYRWTSVENITILDRGWNLLAAEAADDRLDETSESPQPEPLAPEQAEAAESEDAEVASDPEVTSDQR